MLNINVTEDYKLISDGMQIIVQKRTVVDPTKSPNFNPEEHSPEKREEWKNFKYCGKIEHALDIILRQKVLESEAADLKELKREIVSFKKYIESFLA